MGTNLTSLLLIFLLGVITNRLYAAESTLQGRWTSNCIVERGGDPRHPESNMRTVEFKGDALISSDTRFSDPKCHDKAYTSIFTESYVTKPIKSPAGAHSIDITIVKSEGISHKKGIDVPISEGFKPGKKFYGILKLESKSLRFGDYNAESPEERPKVLSGEVAFKKEK